MSSNISGTNGSSGPSQVPFDFHSLPTDGVKQLYSQSKDNHNNLFSLLRSTMQNNFSVNTSGSSTGSISFAALSDAVGTVVANFRSIEESLSKLGVISAELKATSFGALKGSLKAITASCKKDLETMGTMAHSTPERAQLLQEMERKLETGSRDINDFINSNATTGSNKGDKKFLETMEQSIGILNEIGSGINASKTSIQAMQTTKIEAPALTALVSDRQNLVNKQRNHLLTEHPNSVTLFDELEEAKDDLTVKAYHIVETASEHPGDLLVQDRSIKRLDDVQIEYQSLSDQQFMLVKEN